MFTRTTVFSSPDFLTYIVPFDTYYLFLPVLSTLERIVVLSLYLHFFSLPALFLLFIYCFFLPVLHCLFLPAFRCLFLPLKMA